MLGSIQDTLKRVRPPRVKITYDVETGGAIEKKELPFIVGIFADLSNDPEIPLPAVKDRKMVEIDRDNFNDVMKSCQPRIKLKDVPNVLPGGSGTLTGALTFEEQDHFNPLQVVLRVPALRELYDARGRIRGIQAKAEAADAANALMEKLIAEEEAAAEGDAVETKSSADLRTALTAAFAEGDVEAWRNIDATGDEILNVLLTDKYLLMGRAEGEELDLSEAADADPDKAQLKEKAKNALAMLGQFVDDILRPLPDLLGIVPTRDPEAFPGEIARDPEIACNAYFDIKRNADVTYTSLIDNRVAELDCYISRQLSLVLHDPGFQKVEATWRGMAYLVFRTETGTHLKLRVLNISKDDLRKDMQKAVEFDQSAIFKMIYEAEYGTFGGAPYSLLIGDYDFGRTTNDMELLKKMAEIAASAHAPFIAAAYAKLFDLQSFGNLAKPRDLSKIFESVELASWREFRGSEDSRYVTLAMPRVLLRLPYGPGVTEKPVEGIDFCEDVAGNDLSRFLWGNPAFILAERITHAFALYGWTAAIRGVKGGGLVEGLPTYTFKTAEGDVEMVCPTEVTITDRREKELNDLGFMAICHCKNTPQAAFFGGQTTNLPKEYLSDAATANARLSSMLPYILSASRFAHYIKVIMRERIGSFMTRGNVETFLNQWIAQYILLDDDAPQEVKAAYPLREGKVVVTDIPGKPGAYNATVFLKPHFQLEELTTSIRLVAEIPG